MGSFSIWHWLIVLLVVVLAAHGLKPADVLAELRRREGMSGLEEFALRKVRQRESRRSHERRPELHLLQDRCGEDLVTQGS